MKLFFAAATGCLFMMNVLSAEPAAAAAALLKRIPAGTMTLRNGDWLYSRSELEHLSKGELTGGKVVAASICKRKKSTDPAAALKHFHDQLKKLGIALIIIPVPPKSAFYPPDGMKPGDAMKYLTPYCEELRKSGLDLLDPAVIFQKHPEMQTYCRTDAHWSPAGIRLAVNAAAKKIPLRGKTQFSIRKHSILVSGDLAKSLPAAPMKEKLELETVSGKTFSDDSPVLVIGDSHTLIFSSGNDMLAENSGFCELLAAALNMPVERIAVRGSASNSVRIDLFRKSARQPDWIQRKKYVIYLFSCREFTETISGWSLIPVIRNR